MQLGYMATIETSIIDLINQYRLCDYNVLLKNRYDLPKHPGLYIVWGGKQTLEDGLDVVDILYVGRSSNIHKRWNAEGRKIHHRLPHLVRIQAEERYDTVCIYGLFNPTLKDAELKHLESLFIERLNPTLNKTPVLNFEEYIQQQRKIEQDLLVEKLRVGIKEDVRQIVKEELRLFLESQRRS